MLHTPDTFTFSSVYQIEHIECDVPFVFKYNGIFGHVSIRAKNNVNSIINNIDDLSNVVVLKRVLSVVSVKEFWLYLFEHDVYNVNSRYLGGVYREVRKRGTYDTIFQPFFGKGGWVVYGETRNNLERALAARVANKRDNEDKLLFNHSRLTLFGRGVCRVRHSIFSCIRRHLHKKLNDISDDISERVKFAQLPSAKRRIKLLALIDVINSSEYSLFVTHIRGKLKLYEKAKPGKNPRLIGDYTTPGSLLAGYLCEIAKSAFVGCQDGYSQHGFDVCGMYSEFVKSTDSATLDRVGDMLVNDTRNMHFHHSDDSLLKLDGKLYELDISSCDSSNGQPIFDIVSWLFEGTQYKDIIERCIGQCSLGLKVRDPCNYSNSVKLQGIRPFEYSGSTLTTLLNEIASTLIGIQISFDKSNTSEQVINSAMSVGYNVSLVLRDNMSQATLLKNSWDGTRSFLNLGAILRSFGTFSGDLPGSSKIPLDIRCEDFCASLVIAYKHSGLTSVYKALARRYCYHTGYYDDVVKHNLSYSYNSEFARGDISDKAIIDRYCVTQSQIDELNYYITFRPMFQVLSLPIIDKIYFVDYGLKVVDLCTGL
jgi:hypothetical protein